MLLLLPACRFKYNNLLLLSYVQPGSEPSAAPDRNPLPLYPVPLDLAGVLVYYYYCCLSVQSADSESLPQMLCSLFVWKTRQSFHCDALYGRQDLRTLAVTQSSRVKTRIRDLSVPDARTGRLQQVQKGNAGGACQTVGEPMTLPASAMWQTAHTTYACAKINNKY